MEDYRLIETEEYQEDFEDEEELEDEDEDEEVEVGDLTPRVIPIGLIEDDDYDDEEEEDEYGDYWDEDGDLDEDYWDEDEEDEEEEVDELIPVETTSHNVSSSISDGRALQGAVTINDGLLHYLNELESFERNPRNQENGAPLNSGEIDGLFCPICFEAWTSGGSHQICCLPCGHIYGLSCIQKWLQLRRSSGKCPQCKGMCTLKDVRVLYAARLYAADEELHKKVRLLEAKCAYLEQKDFVERIKEELREELKRDMDEKLEKLRIEMVEKMEKLKQDMEEIRMVNMFDEYARNQNRQQNGNDHNDPHPTGRIR